MSEENIAGLVTRAVKQREDNRQWMQFFDELAHMYNPELETFTAEQTPGTERFDEIYISSPQLSRQKFASAIGSFLRPPGTRWLKARARKTPLNFKPEIRAWLDNAARITYDALYDPRALFEERAAECDDQIATFNNGILSLHLDKPKGHFVFKCHSLKDVSPLYDHRGHNIGAQIFVKKKLKHILEMFPEEQLTPKFRQERDKGIKGLDTEFELLNLVLPNDELFGFQKRDRFPSVSLWISVQEKILIDRKGLLFNPYIFVRINSTTGEKFGRGPSTMALNDARTANSIAAALLELTEKRADPPLTAPADVIRGSVDAFAGGLTLFDAQGFQFQGSPIKPIDLGSDPQLAGELLRTLEERIDQAFFGDILSPVPENDRDFTQFDQAAQQQKFQILAQPVFARIEGEYTTQIVERAFLALLKAEVFPPLPDDLRDQEVQFNYDNPLRASAERSEALNDMTALETMGDMNQVAGDNIDTDRLYRTNLIKLGFNAQFFKDPKKLAQEREEARQLAQAQQLAAIAKDAAPAIKAGGDTALQAGEAGLLDQNQLPAPEAA